MKARIIIGGITSIVVAVIYLGLSRYLHTNIIPTTQIIGICIVSAVWYITFFLEFDSTNSSIWQFTMLAYIIIIMIWEKTTNIFVIGIRDELSPTTIINIIWFVFITCLAKMETVILARPKYYNTSN